MPEPEHMPSDLPEPHRSLDLCGDVCPITFAKTKIVLEEMEVGHVLQVILDYEPASRNVPRSVSLYGDEVLSVRQVAPGRWEVLIRKRVP
jgi:tRNA 2-thiouridine synthesizing protein A